MAWAVIHAGKDCENRLSSARFKPAVGARLLIHASKTMTAAEYENATAFMASIGVRCPQRDPLQFGGVIGSVFVRDIVTRSDSPWFRKGATARVRRRKARAVHAGARPDRLVLGPVMIKIRDQRGRLRPDLIYARARQCRLREPDQ
jgi:hypothetical protein